MKILLINEVCGHTSTGRICSDIADELYIKGHSVKIAYGRDDIVPEEDRKYAVRIGNWADVYTHAAISRLFDAAGYGSKYATKRFIQWVDRYNPDIIHLHNLHGYFINIVILFDYLKKCGKPIIWTLHDCWAFTGHSAYCDAVQCERWKKGCYKCPQLKEYPKSYIDRSQKNWQIKRNLFSHVPNMTIVTPSEWLKSLVKQSFLKEYKVITIHNGVDTSIFCPLDSKGKDSVDTKKKRIILGAASIWSKSKGLYDFVQLSSIIDNAKYEILLVGYIPAKDKKKLPKLIRCIDHINGKNEMSYIYNGSDVFVNMTYCDTFPTVNLEAAACGLPIITYDVGGSLETIENCEGYVVKRGDIQAVARKIEDLFNILDINNRTIRKQGSCIDCKASVYEYINQLYLRYNK